MTEQEQVDPSRIQAALALVTDTTPAPPVEAPMGEDEGVRLLLESMGGNPTAPTSEAPTPSQEAASPQETPVKKHELYLQQLAKQKQKYLNKSKELSQREAELNQKIKHGERLEYLESLKTQDPIKFIEEMQLSPKHVVDAYIAKKAEEVELTPQQVAERTANEIVNRRLKEEEEKQINRHNEANYQDVTNAYIVEAKAFLQKNQDRFPALTALNKENDILQYSIQAYEQFGNMPSLEVVAEVLEAKEQEAIENVTKHLLSKPFFNKLLEKNGLAKSSANAQPTRSVTLTNSLSSGSDVKPPEAMTTDELFALAVAQLEKSKGE